MILMYIFFLLFEFHHPFVLTHTQIKLGKPKDIIFSGIGIGNKNIYILYEISVNNF